MQFELLIPIIAILMGGLIVLIPLAAFSARYALKPIMEAVAALREGRAGPVPVAQTERLEQLTAEVETLRERVDELAEAERFRRQLESRKPTQRIG